MSELSDLRFGVRFLGLSASDFGDKAASAFFARRSAFNLSMLLRMAISRCS